MKIKLLSYVKCVWVGKIFKFMVSLRELWMAGEDGELQDRFCGFLGDQVRPPTHQ